MSKINDSTAIKQVKELLRKQNPTVKIMFCPDQFFIGNYSPKLIPTRPIIIEQNANNRASFRFFLAADPRVGYKEKDFGLALTQIEHISIKDEQQENPAVLIVTLTASCFERICKIQTGLKETVEKSFKENKALARNIAVTLKPWNDEPDAFIKVTFNEMDQNREYKFDYEVAKSIMLNDVHAVWSQSVTEQWSRRPQTARNRFYDLLSEMDSHQWVEYLANHNLMKIKCRNGSIQYAKMEENPNGRRQIKMNIEGYPKDKNFGIPEEQDHTDHERKFAKKRKLTQKSFSQPIRWENRDAWVVVSSGKIENDINIKPTFSGATLFRSFDIDNQMANELHMMEQTNYENENIVQKQKSTEESMEYELWTAPLALQRQNVFNTALHELESFQCSYENTENVDDVDAVTEEFSHMGEERYNNEMTNVHEFHEQNWHSEQIQNAEAYSSHQPGDTETIDLNISYTEMNSLDNTLQSILQNAHNSNAAFSQGDYAPPSPHQQNPQQGPSVPPVPVPQQARPVEERISGDTQLFIFPPSGKSVPGMDAVSLLLKDVKTLDRREFLNDNVMSFMLNYIGSCMISRELMSRILMCNTFFYVNLTRQLPPLCFSQRKPLDENHKKMLIINTGRVLRWTRKFDVFTKDYLIIPVNEDLHWLVIAVINPSGAIVDMSDEKASRAAPKCYVVFYDPLSGLDPSKRNHMCHCVKVYLSQLYEQTKGPGMKFASVKPTKYDEERVVVVRPNNTPIQNNFYDCGLYALHFIEGLFCYPNSPVTVNDFPDFDWSKLYPEANKMCDLMRDKVYNLIHQQSDPVARSRLDRYERAASCGLSREGTLRKSRRHSAVNLRRLPRHQDHYARHYSLCPPSRNVMNDDPTFLNPRGLAEMPVTQLIRSLRIPEENFPIAY